jgi:hypothetical protein
MMREHNRAFMRTGEEGVPTRCANPPSRTLAAPGKVETGDVHEKRRRENTMSSWRDDWIIDMSVVIGCC